MAKNTHNEERYILEISRKIKQLRIDQGYTSYENFAHENNLDRKQYWRVENGQNITIKTLTKVLDKLNLPISEFFKDIK